jgi:hypothetical protein
MGRPGEASRWAPITHRHSDGPGCLLPYPRFHRHMTTIHPMILNLAMCSQLAASPLAPHLTTIRNSRLPSPPRPSCELAITLDASPPALPSTRNRPRRAVRQGAAWPAKPPPPSSCLSWRWSSPVRRSVMPLVVLAAELSWCVARPHSVCPAEPPAGIQRSGTVAMLDNARTPAVASVAGPRPARGVHISSAVVRALAVRPSGVRPSGVRSAGFVVRAPASGRLVSARPVSAGWCPAVRCPAVRCPPRPSGRVRLVPHQAVAVGTGRYGKATHTTGTGRGPDGRPRRRAARVDGPSRTGRGRRRRGRAWSAGCRWRTQAGCGRRPP